jgi:hypothetical protein
VANEHVIFYLDTLAYETVARDLAICSYHGVSLYLHERPDLCILTDRASIEIDEA